MLTHMLTEQLLCGVDNKCSKRKGVWISKIDFREEDRMRRSIRGYQDFRKTCNNSKFML